MILEIAVCHDVGRHTKMTRVFVAGHRGMVGSAIVRRLAQDADIELLTQTRQQLNLFDQSKVAKYLKDEKPDYIFLAAAKVGGIAANSDLPADFIYQNLLIQNNLIGGAFAAGIGEMCFLGSSCIYPRDCPQPIKEEYLMTGPLELTNEPYAVGKIAGLKMCEAFNRQYGTNYLTIMPTNLYGPNDNYDLKTGHMLPALLRKAHETKMAGRCELELWGTGTPRRELLYVDDLADACVHLMKNKPNFPILNVGTGQDLTIAEIATVVMEVVGLDGLITLDTSKPDGTPQKLLDVSRLNSCGWKAKTSLSDGVTLTYDSYLASLV